MWRRRSLALWNSRPIVEIENDGGIVFAGVVLVREVRARLVLGRDETQAQRAGGAEIGGVEHFAPREERVACEKRIDVTAGVDRQHERCAAEAIESKRAS